MTTTASTTTQLDRIPVAEAVERINARRDFHTMSRRATRDVARLLVVMITAIFVLVGMSAYAASLQHANNVLIKENEYLQAEIDSLNSQIVEETKVTRVENLATKEYGMVYPTKDNCIVIAEGTETGDNLAAFIRSEAYN